MTRAESLVRDGGHLEVEGGLEGGVCGGGGGGRGTPLPFRRKCETQAKIMLISKAAFMSLGSISCVDTISIFALSFSQIYNINHLITSCSRVSSGT